MRRIDALALVCRLAPAGRPAARRRSARGVKNQRKDKIYAKPQTPRRADRRAARRVPCEPYAGVGRGREAPPHKSARMANWGARRARDRVVSAVPSDYSTLECRPYGADRQSTRWTPEVERKRGGRCARAACTCPPTCRRPGANGSRAFGRRMTREMLRFRAARRAGWGPRGHGFSISCRPPSPPSLSATSTGGSA